MLRRPLQRLIALALVLVMTAATAAPAWAVSVVPVPGHHLAIAAVAPPDAAGCGDCGDHGAASVTHADCVICLGLALPVGLADPLQRLPAGFAAGRHTSGAGLPPDHEPHPPRSSSHRI